MVTRHIKLLKLSCISCKSGSYLYRKLNTESHGYFNKKILNVILNIFSLNKKSNFFFSDITRYLQDTKGGLFDVV